MIEGIRGQVPVVAQGAFVHDRAVVSGGATIGARASVWPCAVIRADIDRIEIGCESNVQDNACLHVAVGYPCIVGDRVTVGHGAILHGCTIGDDALIGMGAIVLDGAVVEPGAMVGAGALVPPGATVPAGHLAVGVPCKVVRPLRGEEVEANRGNAREYVELGAQAREGR